MSQHADAESRPKAGVLAAANGLVKVRDTTDQNAQPRSLAVGGAVYFKDELITPEGVKAQILLKDQTTFALSGNAKMVLDEFVYDPKGKKTESAPASRRALLSLCLARSPSKTPKT